MDGSGVKSTFKAKKYFHSALCIGRGLVAAGAPTLPCFGAQGTQIVFDCTNLASGATWQIKVDLQASTVDSNPARISSSTISWRDGADGGKYTLERSTGNLTVFIASSTGGYFIHDRCRPRG